MHTLAPRTVLLAAALLFPCSQAQASADAFDWLAGQWCGGEGTERVEEHWLAPANGDLLGVSRTLKNGRMASFEFLLIAKIAGVPTYLAQPGGRQPTAFPRSAGGEDWVRFENLAHDFPTRIEYRRTGDALQARISGIGGDGKEITIAFDFVRCEG